ISSPTRNRLTNYSPIPKRKKLGIITVPQHLIKAPALTQVGARQGVRLVVQLVQVDRKVLEASARISISRIFSEPSPVVLGGVEGLANLLCRKKYSWDRTLKFRPTSRSWMPRKELARTYIFILSSNAEPVPVKG
ncbi:MAG: hypothetical protein Q9198_008147, partial [Flavoplaca austrocitrina]